MLFTVLFFMGHDHAHHHHAEPITHPGKAFWISIGLNLAYVVAELVAGLVYHSMALLTDAGHNISDVASLLLSLLAFSLAKRKSTKRFTYGFKKTTILAALANAVILLVAIGVLGVETIRRFSEPYQVQGGVIAWVAGMGIVVNSLSAFLFYKGRKGDLNVKSAYLHLLADALVSLGVVLAGIVISFTGWYVLDPLVGSVVLVVILVSTWGLLADSFKLSVDAVPAGIDLEQVKDVIRKVPHVQDVHHVHVWAISTTENSLTAHVQIDDRLDFEQKLQVVREIKHELEHANIRHSTIEIESSRARAHE